MWSLGGSLNNMKAWLKWGLIVSLIGIILFFILFLISGYENILWITHFPFVIYNTAFNYEVMSYFGGPRFWSNMTPSGFIHFIIGLLISIVLYFIVGAIIGLIVGKIRSRKQVKQNVGVVKIKSRKEKVVGDRKV
jgi:hypothetical protein